MRCLLTPHLLSLQQVCAIRKLASCSTYRFVRYTYAGWPTPFRTIATKTYFGHPDVPRETEIVEVADREIRGPNMRRNSRLIFSAKLPTSLCDSYGENERLQP